MTMDETTNIIRDFYNAGIDTEWSRIASRPEFLLTCRMLNRYIKPGDTILDIGGGPGRYSHYLAAKDCKVTLSTFPRKTQNSQWRRPPDKGLQYR